jgi:hypothetical protein
MWKTHGETPEKFVYKWLVIFHIYVNLYPRVTDTTWDLGWLQKQANLRG